MEYLIFTTGSIRPCTLRNVFELFGLFIGDSPASVAIIKFQCEKLLMKAIVKHLRSCNYQSYFMKKFDLGLLLALCSYKLRQRK